MTNYNVGKGDCLWNIAKAQYGDKLKNNSDVMKAVNQIASTNNIKTSDLIFANQQLEIPAYEDIFTILENGDEAAEYTDTDNLIDDTDTALYDEMTEWQKDGYERIMAGQKELPMFDFVKSNVSYTDPAFMEDWKQGVQNMAQSNLAASDTDKNGALNYAEYANQELNSYNELYSDEQIAFDKATGEIKDNDEMNALMRQNFTAIDADKNAEIDKAELSAYYAAMDSIDSSDGSADGKLQIASTIHTDFTSNDFQKRFLNALKIFNTKQPETAFI